MKDRLVNACTLHWYRIHMHLHVYVHVCNEVNSVNL